MKRLFVVLGTAAAVIMIYSVFAGRHYVYDAATNEDRIRCIEQFGWETDGAVLESEDITIPDPLGAVYEEYNKMQKEIGLDLEKHKGETAKRYTYEVKNHPDAKGRQVRADILVSDGKMIAGDIMVTALDGYMHALNRRE